MNKKQQIIRELRQEAGGAGWISKSKIQRYIGKRKSYVDELVDGLERLHTEKDHSHLYHVTDVAERIVGRIH